MQALRDYYLQTMGIQVWQSREVLPGAKPVSFAVNCSEQAASFEGDTAPIELESAETSSPLTSPDELLASSPDVAFATTDVPTIIPVVEPFAAAQTEKSSPAADVVAEQNAAVVQTPNPEFRLASVIFPGVCVVVTEVPVQSVAPIAAEQLTFLNELLLAINVPTVDEPLLTLFNWPMLRSADFDQSADAARDASQAFLRGQKSRHTIGFVLLMGDAPGQYLLSEQGDFTEKTGRLFQSDEQPCLLTCSLEQVFADSKLKAQVWHDLQPLMAWQQEQ